MKSGFVVMEMRSSLNLKNQRSSLEFLQVSNLRTNRKGPRAFFRKYKDNVNLILAKAIDMVEKLNLQIS